MIAWKWLKERLKKTSEPHVGIKVALSLIPLSYKNSCFSWVTSQNVLLALQALQCNFHSMRPVYEGMILVLFMEVISLLFPGAP